MFFKMISEDGRTSFYQWDTNRKLRVLDDSNQIHFWHEDSPDTVYVVNAEDNLVAVPDELLQNDGRFYACPYDNSDNKGKFTRYKQCFRIAPRPKPADYIYTPAEKQTWEQLKDKLDTAVLFTEQTLTEEQQIQALENIRAVDKYNGLKRYDVEYKNSNGTIAKNTIYTNGALQQPDELSTSTNIGMAWTRFNLWLGMAVGDNEPSLDYLVKALAAVADAGCFGDNFWETTYATRRIFTKTPTKLSDDYLYAYSYNADEKTVWVKKYYEGASYEVGYSINTGKFTSYCLFYAPAIRPTSTTPGTAANVSQFFMKSDPTADMQVATKKYVDEHLEPETDDLKMAFEGDVLFMAGGGVTSTLTYGTITKMLRMGRPGVLHVTYRDSGFRTYFDAVYGNEELDSNEEICYCFYSTADINGTLTVFKLSIDKDDICRKEIIAVGSPGSIQVDLTYNSDNDAWSCSHTYEELAAALDAGKSIAGTARFNDAMYGTIIAAARQADHICISTTDIMDNFGYIYTNVEFIIFTDDGTTMIDMVGSDFVCLMPEFPTNSILLRYDDASGKFIAPDDITAKFNDIFLFKSLDISAFYKPIYLQSAPTGYEDTANRVFFPSATTTGSLVFRSVDTTAAITVTIDYDTGEFTFDISRIIPNDFRLASSAEGSTKQFKITVDDNGTLSATEVTT